MAAKKGKPSKKGGNNNSNRDEMEQDDRLQAIVLTDSFETRFMPLTASKPRCLLPLANIPLIEYTLESLAMAAVKEVYLVCSAHADQIIEYIENSKWNLPWSPFKVTTIMSPESRSIGDAMRDIDNRGIITGDFILISGDLVTNIEFDKVLEFHKKAHQNDKDHILTMCLSKATGYYKTRSIQPATFILDKSNNKCIYYEDIPLAHSKSKSALSIDPELLEDVEEFSLRNDLIDCRIDICSQQVPPLFQDNFDYQSLRSDFVKGVISSDLLRKGVYAYITDEYAVRAESWHAYDVMSQDFLGRWAYPIVLDANFLEDQTYSYESSHIYKEKDVVLAQSCKIGKCTAIGSGTKIGEGSSIENCVIGRNCQIGENISIRNSYIWDNTNIGNNSIINHSIIASDVNVGANVLINKGCVIGFNVTIDDNMVVPESTKLSSVPIKSGNNDMFSQGLSEDSDSEAAESVIDKSTKCDVLAVDIVGENGVGYVYESDVSDDEEDSISGNLKNANSLVNQMEELYLSDDSIASATTKTKKKRTMSSNSMYTDKDDTEFEDDEDFEEEGIATVERAIENNHDLDTAMLELNTLRMSMNVTYHEVRTVTIMSMLRRVNHFIFTQTLGAKEAVAKVFNQWGMLFKRQCFEDEDFIDLINIILDQVLKIDFEKPELILFVALNSLYDNDILEEENIYEWWKTISQETKYSSVTSLTAKWVEWLQNADEESSEESSEEES
ncbi:hypothetical protein Kpol_1031p45 [Vanderwaltozyma polyspora DSM 70294]|uniref:Translation initiation factor eIF2B subunit epsilon n=1 Tax=Vanderwaltozyma polyspora (strain ATCC 22028 / DSM 70294 / BCRC 21397 / CBS 2163 / NBRC 10782 / NRRL Y-8283 / UCD 57-17) TaxID=436907 RepID=A7THX7_VANPO|nr:uncharacterized protein Kpol_1031p45 [Vanderwaltozyma polyspora DSM 70294]EDO18139.1 hypothetical protein Kpol_1031p45 [Vanderwaltozyma polyspora DSM 70294]